jgi:hypothetical protein
MIFVAFFIICLMAVLAVLWCLWGFSRELRRSRRTIGLVVRVHGEDANASPKKDSRTESASRNPGAILEFPASTPTTKPGATRRSEQARRSIMSLAGLMILTGSWNKGGTPSKPMLGEMHKFENARSLIAEATPEIPAIQPLTTPVYG